MRTRPLLSLGITLALLLGTPGFADTKNGYSKPSSSSSFSKPSSDRPAGGPLAQGRYFKPAPSAVAQSAPPGYSKPGQPTSASASSAPRNAADVAVAKGQSKQALAQFDADQRRFRAPPVAAPPSPKAAQQSPVWQRYGNRWHTADDYYAARSRAEARLPLQAQHYYTSPPVWVVQGPPSYGQYYASFLGGVLLGSAGTAEYDHWAYNHRTDPDYLRWHADMERQAADNAELREKLNRLDAQVATLEAAKAPVTESDEIDPALVVAPQIVKLATTDSGWNWWLWGPVIVLVLGGGFVVVCVGISRRRQRLV